MTEERLIVVTLDNLERELIRESVTCYITSLNLDNEPAAMVAALKEAVKKLLEKIK